MSSQMTINELLEKLDKLEREATSGPWEANEVDGPNVHVTKDMEIKPDGRISAHWICECDMQEPDNEYEQVEVNNNNAILIAESRNHLRTLLTLIEKYREALEFISNREGLTFAECSDAEEIINKARQALALRVEDL